MQNKTPTLMLLVAVVALAGCSRGPLHKDFGNSVKKNTVLQTVNISAPQESHPDVKMDGVKAADVVKNYRKETPKVTDEKLTN